MNSIYFVLLFAGSALAGDSNPAAVAVPKKASEKRGVLGLGWPGGYPLAGDAAAPGPWVPLGPQPSYLPAYPGAYPGSYPGSYPGPYPGAIPAQDYALAKGAAHTINLQSENAVNAAEVHHALAAAKEASAAAAVAQQRVQQAKEAVLIHQRIAAAKEAAASAAIQRSEAAAATASAIQRSEAAAQAIHRQEAAAAAAAAQQRSEAASQAASAIQRSQIAHQQIQKTAAKAAAANAILNHAAGYPKHIEYPWG